MENNTNNNKNMENNTNNNQINDSRSYRSDDYDPQEGYDPFQYYDDYEINEPCYDEYAGSYASDYGGWDDDMIDAVLDGQPDAYWNID